jgi:hypothetical protein
MRRVGKWAGKEGNSLAESQGSSFRTDKDETELRLATGRPCRQGGIVAVKDGIAPVSNRGAERWRWRDGLSA